MVFFMFIKKEDEHPSFFFGLDARPDGFAINDVEQREHRFEAAVLHLFHGTEIVLGVGDFFKAKADDFIRHRGFGLKLLGGVIRPNVFDGVEIISLARVFPEVEAIRGIDVVPRFRGEGVMDDAIVLLIDARIFRDGLHIPTAMQIINAVLADDV